MWNGFKFHGSKTEISSDYRGDYHINRAAFVRGGILGPCRNGVPAEVWSETDTSALNNCAIRPRRV